MLVQVNRVRFVVRVLQCLNFGLDAGYAIYSFTGEPYKTTASYEQISIIVRSLLGGLDVMISTALWFDFVRRVEFQFLAELDKL